MQADYLENDRNRGNASDLLTAALMATMFFTPVGGKVMKGAWGGIKGVGRGFRGLGSGTLKGLTGEALKSPGLLERFGGKLGSEVSKYGVKGLARTGGEVYNVATAAARTVARVADFAVKHQKAVTASVVGAAAVIGGATAMEQRNPNQFTSAGPESRTSFEDGMPHDNLGATGDLTLALHNNRRR